MGDNNSFLSLSLDEVVASLQERPVMLLKTEHAIAYFAFAVLSSDDGDYATSIRNRCSEEFPGCDISDTILYRAIHWWERQAGGLEVERRRPEGGGRGRTQNVYRFSSLSRDAGLRMADAWKKFYGRLANGG